MPTTPSITIARKTGAAALSKRISSITKLAAYVGVPSSGTKDRSQQLEHMAQTTPSKNKKAKLVAAAAANDVSNAELLYLHTKGSPARRIPARPVLEPAVEADGNRQIIARELAASIQASTRGETAQARAGMKRTALAGQNAARKWFTDPRNNWAPNSPGTVAAKGSDRPLIDTGALRAAIVGLVQEEK